MFLNNTGLENLYNQIDGKKVFITGGTGTLGKALLRRFPQATVFSRDPWKQQQTKQQFPDARYVLGDIRDYDGLYKAITGHDIVIHAAAMKHIPQAEDNVQNCIETNVVGSANVAYAAVNAGIERCVGISTDKVCYPINVYGHSKALMERLFLEYNKVNVTNFTLCRYGNVIGSTGSVVDLWRKQISNGLNPTVTDPDMTRFWLGEDDALYLIGKALTADSGTITIPLAPGLSMRKFIDYMIGDYPTEVIGLRPGEKMHECLIAAHEVWDCDMESDFYNNIVTLYPNQNKRFKDISVNKEYFDGYFSNQPKWELSKEDLDELVENYD